MTNRLLVLAALLALVACNQSPEAPAAETTVVEDAEFTPDFAAATREAVADTAAAARDAGPAPAASPTSNTPATAPPTGE